MERLDRAISELRSMEMEARGEGLIQSLNPLSKLFVTVFYLVILLSFHKYDLSGLLLMGVYPILMFTIGNIPLRPMWRRMSLILIPICLIGIANPFFDRVPVSPGSIVTGGMVSMATLLLKGLYAVAAAYLMMVTTQMEDLCRALRKLHIPAILVTVIMLIYRYLSVFLEEVARIRTAYSMRAPGQKGVHFKVWGSLAGMLLLRSIDRSEAVYQSMSLRGFQGEFPFGQDRTFSRRDLIYVLFGIIVPLIIRYL